MAEFADVVRRRRMTRAFDPDAGRRRPILERLVDLASRAPSAGKAQGWHLVVLEGERDRHRSGTSRCRPMRRGSFRWQRLLERAGHRPAVRRLEGLHRPLRRTRQGRQTGLGAGAEAWPAPYWTIDSVDVGHDAAAGRRGCRARRAVLRRVPAVSAELRQRLARPAGPRSARRDGHRPSGRPAPVDEATRSQRRAPATPARPRSSIGVRWRGEPVASRPGRPVSASMNPRPCPAAPGRRSRGTRRRIRRGGRATAASRTARPRPARCRAARTVLGDADEIGPVADDRHLGDAAPPEIHGEQGVRVAADGVAEDPCRSTGGSGRRGCVALLAGQGGEAQQRDRPRSSSPTAWRCRADPSGGRSDASASSAVVYRPPFTGSQNQSSIVSAIATASSIQRACPVASPRRVKASTSAAWSAASASWRAGGSPSACQLRHQRPVRPPQLAQQELAVGDRRVEPVLLTERRRPLRPVPTGTARSTR